MRLAEPCPLLPISALDVRGVVYTDADPPRGLVSRIQEALRQLSATDEQGRSVEVDGRYDTRTAHILHRWVSEDPRRWPDARLVHLTGGAWVTDCTVYRALGLECPSVFVADGVTPNADRLHAEVEAGLLPVTCRVEAPVAPSRRSPFLAALLASFATVVGAPWLSRSR